MELAKVMADKTNWRAILQGENEPIDLAARARTEIPLIESALADIRDRFGPDTIEHLAADVVSISYPVSVYPDKIKSFNFDKQPVAEGTLLGIKGQYLIFDTGVINIRKFTGYEVAPQERTDERTQKPAMDPHVAT